MLTFSIPNRIEPSATLRRGNGWRRERAFQYPQSDRALCNTVGSFQSPPAPDFQYPQSDRALCNRPGRPGGASWASAFSIPNRIEPSATPWRDAGRCRHVHFQYPQSDRALCNYIPRYALAGTAFSFQYPQSDRALCNCILLIVPSTPSSPFSIPNRIEPSATSQKAAIKALVLRFQYPQSDRALCNLSDCTGRGGGVELSVSPIGSSPLQRLLAASLKASDDLFQYPQSDRALCNFELRPTATRISLQLSVSPIGSSPLQLGPAILTPRGAA